MEPQKIVKDAQVKFDQALERFNTEASKLRTGRAHPSMLEGVMVEAYGVQTPLIQVATISVPETTSLAISPFDPSNIAAISAGIRAKQDLGLNPSDDGKVVRVPIPPLTTERRQQIVKTLKEKTEEAYVAMRNARHDALKSVKAAELPQDQAKSTEGQIDDAMSKTKSAIEQSAKAKETDILTV